MQPYEAGFEEIEHTADWALRVWAPNLPSLFAHAMAGMYVLSDTILYDKPRFRRIINLESENDESLLISFLSEIVFIGEQEDLGFDEVDIEIIDGKLTARLEGAPFLSREKEIKAVTYHNLEIKKTRKGFEVEIVFDV
jgi:SHS2 domain-containing protein